MREEKRGWVVRYEHPQPGGAIGQVVPADRIEAVGLEIAALEVKEALRAAGIEPGWLEEYEL